MYLIGMFLIKNMQMVKEHNWLASTCILHISLDDMRGKNLTAISIHFKYLYKGKISANLTVLQIDLFINNCSCFYALG